MRLDDRLIHGQVVVGWGQVLSPDLLVLADDAIAENAWEADLYRAGVPEGVNVEVTTVLEAANHMKEWSESGHRTIVLVGDVASLVRLCDNAPSVRAVNLGGLHDGDGRRRRLAYLYLSEAEVQQLKDIATRGVTITAQDLPNATPVTLDEIA